MMPDDRNLLELAAMYSRLAARCRTPEMILRFRNLSVDCEAAAARRSSGTAQSAIPDSVAGNVPGRPAS